MKISTKGLGLIKEFEGCKLTAYFCPAGVLSIGFGSTGPHVSTGQTITEAEAEALLLKDLVRFEKAVNELVKVPMTQGAYDALVSFTFNCGEGAFADSTLLRELNEGKNPNAVAKAQLPRWTNGGLAGLVRRRPQRWSCSVLVVAPHLLQPPRPKRPRPKRPSLISSA